MKNILIVGGAGFIGTQLQSSLRETDANVFVIDSLLERVHGSSPKIQVENFFRIDSRDPSRMLEILRLRVFDEIYFLASDTSTGESLYEIDNHVSQNTTAISGLLKALTESKRMPERIILTSSRAVYGEGHQIDISGKISALEPRKLTDLQFGLWFANRDEKQNFSPNHYKNSTNPNNVYGLTKLFQEKLLAIWCEANRVTYDIYRLQNVIGPGQSPKNSYSGVITTFCVQALSGNRLKIFENGEIIRDFVHVKDVVAALKIPLKDGFNCVDIGTGLPLKLSRIAEIISSECLIQEPELTNDFRVGDVCTAYADSSSLEGLSQFWTPRPIDVNVVNEILDFVRGDLQNV